MKNKLQSGKEINNSYEFNDKLKKMNKDLYRTMQKIEVHTLN